MKRLTTLLALIVLALILFFVIQGQYRASIDYALDPNSSEQVHVLIPDGASAKDIAKLLKEAELIRYELAFTHYLGEKNLDISLKSGHYFFQKNQTMPQLIDTLVAGAVGELSITVLEGWTAEQIAEKLEALGMTTKQAFMDCLQSCSFDYDFLPEGYLEGYLYPDTYFLDYDFYNNQRFIGEMIGNLETRLASDWQAIEQSGRSFEEIMIIASIIEREANPGPETAVIGGIMWNRLEAGMRLDADATVLYALGRTSGGLSGTDLEVESPYNTRRNTGLPPTPISNPGIESIHGALYPTQTNYYYYLHDAQGNIHYAETNEAHNVNKANYL